MIFSTFSISDRVVYTRNRICVTAQLWKKISLFEKTIYFELKKVSLSFSPKTTDIHRTIRGRSWKINGWGEKKHGVCAELAAQKILVACVLPHLAGEGLITLSTTAHLYAASAVKLLLYSVH